MTPAQQSLVDTISGALQQDGRLEAAWLAGSLGRGAGDAFSDVDVVVLCPDGTASEIAATPGLLDFAKPVLVNTLFGGRIVNVVTLDWQRFDLVFVETSDLARYNANALKPLFNRTGREPPRSEPVPYRATPESVLKLVQEFFRVMSLAPLGIGRNEYIVALSGIELLRRMTVDLMLEENNVGQQQRGGALRLNPFLNSDQIQLLQSLPAVAAERVSIVRCQKAIANIFCRGRRRSPHKSGWNGRWPWKKHRGRILNRNWISRSEGQLPEISFSIASRILNFCGLPVTVIGTASTKRI